VIASHVAEFESPAPAQVSQHPLPPHAYPPHPMHIMQHPHYANPYALPQQVQNGVKSEQQDNRYLLSMPYSLPPLPGPTVNGVRPLAGPVPSHPGGRTGIISFPRQLHPQPTGARPYVSPPVTQSQPQSQPQSQQPQPSASQEAQRIPQVDGPSESSDDEDSPPPSQNFAPRSAHPSLPQPMASSSASVPQAPQDLEAINSDLDDSDTEGEEEAEEGVAGESDIVFCTYDKVGIPRKPAKRYPSGNNAQVARVKNKWKCILKDGMIHINGKDYLFAKCTGYVCYLLLLLRVTSHIPQGVRMVSRLMGRFHMSSFELSYELDRSTFIIPLFLIAFDLHHPLSSMYKSNIFTHRSKSLYKCFRVPCPRGEKKRRKQKRSTRCMVHKLDIIRRDYDVYIDTEHSNVKCLRSGY